MKGVQIFARPAMLGVAGMIIGAGQGWAAAASPATNAPAEFSPPLSAFIWKTNDPNFGRDPFFPLTARGGRWAPKKVVVIPPIIPTQVVANVTQPVAVVTQPVEVIQQPPLPEVPLTLDGVFGRTSALINNSSFRKGEIGIVNTSAGRFRIRLDEIKEGLVNVTIWIDADKTIQRPLLLGGNK